MPARSGRRTEAAETAESSAAARNRSITASFYVDEDFERRPRPRMFDRRHAVRQVVARRDERPDVHFVRASSAFSARSNGPQRDPTIVTSSITMGAQAIVCSPATVVFNTMVPRGRTSESAVGKSGRRSRAVDDDVVVAAWLDV